MNSRVTAPCGKDSQMNISTQQHNPFFGLTTQPPPTTPSKPPLVERDFPSRTVSARSDATASVGTAIPGHPKAQATLPNSSPSASQQPSAAARPVSRSLTTNTPQQSLQSSSGHGLSRTAAPSAPPPFVRAESASSAASAMPRPVLPPVARGRGRGTSVPSAGAHTMVFGKSGSGIAAPPPTQYRTIGGSGQDTAAFDRRLQELWKHPPPYSLLERSIGARLRSEAEVSTFVKGILRLQQIARPRLRMNPWALVKNAAYRWNVAQEILKTEEVYVQNLDILCNIFLDPLLKLAQTKKEPLPQMSNLFSNLMVIRNFNKTLLQDLRPRITSWSSTQCIGDVFVSASQYLKSYTMYVSAYNNASAELVEGAKRCSELDDFLSQLAQSEQTARQTIYAYLIQPVQRIPRYRLLLADLLKHTSASHKDWKNIDQAHNLIGETATLVNTKTAEAERTLKVMEIQSRLLNCMEALVTPSRRFVSQTNLVLVWNTSMKTDQMEKRWLFIFNDLLVEAKPTGQADLAKFKQSYHLAHLYPARKEEDTKNTEYCFSIHMIMGGGEVMLKIFFKDRDERDRTNADLKKLLSEIKTNRQKYEELVDKRARDKAEKTKELFDARYSLSNPVTAIHSNSAEGSPVGENNSKWEARLRAMKERQEALRKQPINEDSAHGKSRSLSISEPTEAGQSSAPSEGAVERSSSVADGTSKPKKRGSISRLSSIFSSSPSSSSSTSPAAKKKEDKEREKLRKKEEKEKEKLERQQRRKERAKTFDTTRHKITKEDIAAGGDPRHQPRLYS